MIPAVLESFDRDGIAVPASGREHLLKISPASIDRMLKTAKQDPRQSVAGTRSMRCAKRFRCARCAVPSRGIWASTRLRSAAARQAALSVGF